MGPGRCCVAQTGNKRKSAWRARGWTEDDGKEVRRQPVEKDRCFLAPQPGFYGLRERGVSGAGKRGFADGCGRVVPSFLISVLDPEAVGT